MISIGYENLDKVSLDLFRISSNISVRAVCKTARKDNEGKRVYCHNEYDYYSNFYNDRTKLKSIKLYADAYFEIIDTNRDWTDKNSIRIGYLQKPRFLRGLKIVIDWFNKPDLFYYDKKNILNLNGDYLNLDLIIELSFDQCVRFKPIVINNYETRYEGVMMQINTDKCYGFITIDNLIALYESLKEISVFQIQMGLLNYVRRPDFDVFKNEIKESPIINNIIGESETIINKRKIDDDKKDYFKFK